VSRGSVTNFPGDVCRRALAPPDPARRAAMRPVLDAWVRMIAVARAASVPVIYTTPRQPRRWRRCRHAADRQTGVPPLTNAVEGSADAGFPDEIAPRLSDCTQWVPPQSACCSVGRMGSMRARSNSIPALPSIARLSVFSRLI
jgi:hypothetical protein